MAKMMITTTATKIRITANSISPSDWPGGRLFILFPYLASVARTSNPTGSEIARAPNRMVKIKG